MELTKIIQIMSEPEKIIDPERCNLVSTHISGFITENEELLNEQNYQVSVKHIELYKQSGKISVADREIELTDIYRARVKTKLTLSQLKRFKGDLNDRFRVLTFKRY